MGCNVLLISFQSAILIFFTCEKYTSRILILSYILVMRYEHVTFSNLMVTAAREDQRAVCGVCIVVLKCHTLRQIFVWAAKRAFRSWPIREY